MNTKEKILRAAVKVFAEKGYKATTTRDICGAAGCNINGVSYYFGGKDPLYKAVLEFMFTDAEKFIPDKDSADITDATPEQMLGVYIHTFCKIMLAINEEIDEHLAALFVKETANPSPYLDEMVERYLAPSDQALNDILLQIMGKDAPEETIRDVGCSIMGQIFYYSFAWPIFIRMHPDHPGMDSKIDYLAEHVTRFSMGGIQAVMESYKTSKGRNLSEKKY